MGSLTHCQCHCDRLSKSLCCELNRMLTHSQVPGTKLRNVGDYLLTFISIRIIVQYSTVSTITINYLGVMSIFNE